MYEICLCDNANEGNQSAFKGRGILPSLEFRSFALTDVVT